LKAVPIAAGLTLGQRNLRRRAADSPSAPGLPSALGAGPMPIYELECEEWGSRFEELVAGAAPSARGGPGGARERGGQGEGGRRRTMSSTAEERRSRLVDSYNEAIVCERCPLAATRNRVVFGAGNADADLMFVGEAPGAEEDRQGLPFVGRAGSLLSQLLAEIGMTRDDVFIANVLMCRPPGNRDPQPIEIESCHPYLLEKIDLIEPRVVCTLGNFATKLLTGNRAGITRVRGTPQVQELGRRTVFLLPLFHPAAALRTPAMAETLRSDFRLLPELLSEDLPGSPRPAADDAAAQVDPQPDQLGFFG
jgi:uracil-DNA glycosylase family 4